MPVDTNILLVGKDGGQTPVRRDVAIRCSMLLQELLDDEASSSEVEVPLDVLSTTTIALVVSYMTQRFQNPPAPIPKPLNGPLEKILDEIDTAFVKDFTPTTTIDLVNAANFLNYPALRDLVSAKLASIMMSMTVEENRAMLGIQQDFSAQHEAQLRKMHGIASS